MASAKQMLLSDVPAGTRFRYGHYTYTKIQLCQMLHDLVVQKKGTSNYNVVLNGSTVAFYGSSEQIHVEVYEEDQQPTSTPPSIDPLLEDAARLLR